jgi:protein DGCR14
LNEENKQRREKYGWAWEAQAKVEAQRERMIETRERMLIEPVGGAIPGVREKFRIEAPKPAGLITVAGEEEMDGEGEQREKGEAKKEEMAIVLKATSVEEATAAVMAPRKDERTAGVDGWKFKARCHCLMKLREMLMYLIDSKLIYVFTRCRHFALPSTT